MKILLFGKNGQLGQALQQALAPLSEVIALDRNGQPGLCGDLTQLEGLRHTISQLKPDAIFNAAAYTQVDKAESEANLAFLINALAPQVMAEEMHKLGGWLVHYSTDYVFNGEGNSPWQENDKTQPLNTYGKSKLAGEQAIQASQCQHLIFRTSWLYSANGNNFLKTILRLAQERETLNVVNDQIGTPTSADLLATVTAKALAKAINNAKPSGIYHLAAQGETSWHHYAECILAEIRKHKHPCKLQHINPVSTEHYPSPAQRPKNSRLNTRKFCQQFELTLPHWQADVISIIPQLLATQP